MAPIDSQISRSMVKVKGQACSNMVENEGHKCYTNISCCIPGFAWKVMILLVPLINFNR